MKHGFRKRVHWGALVLVLGGGLVRGEEPGPRVDLHDLLMQVNKAQIVMLTEEGLVERGLGQRLAGELAVVVEEEAKPGAPRSPQYSALERRLTQTLGPEASNLHLGRSNNDLNETVNRLVMREWLIALAQRLAALREVVQKLAGENLETVMPGFTHAVQAQPTTLAHVLLAFDASLARDGERLREAYERINLSPLGSGAFTTSGFALNRDRLAALLGFPGLVENSYDATMVSIADSKVEFASVLSLSALGIGRFAQYLLMQYDAPVPGLMLEGAITTRSSLMPQKRNPSAIERLRLNASEVVGAGVTSSLMVHNTPMYEVKDAREDHMPHLTRLAELSERMFERAHEVVGSLRVNREILRELVDADFSTMSELADLLHREAGIPFRAGYRVASELATYGRQHGKPPLSLTHHEVSEVYQKATGEQFPLSAEQMAEAFDPTQVVANRKGRGGPQRASVERLLKAQAADLSGFREWAAGQREKLAVAEAALEEEFLALAGTPAETEN